MNESRAMPDLSRTEPKTFWTLLSRTLCGWPGFLILLAVLLPFKISRAKEENSFWIDEVYSVLLSERNVGDLISLTSIDDHPPFYYLLLKAWNMAGKAVNLGPSLWWTRSLNIFVWILLAASAWLLGRALLGRGTGTLLAWAVAGGSQAAHAIRDIRSYGFAITAMFTCFLALLLLWKRNREMRRMGAGDFLLWGLYALCGIVGLYSHLLTSFVLFLLGLAWIGMVLEAGPGNKKRFFFWGAASQAIILLVFAPWLVRIGEQVTHIQGGVREWMTPRTAWNLIRVFIYWNPYGRMPYRSPFLPLPVYLLGIMSVAAPWGAALWARQSSQSRRGEGAASLMVAATGMSIAVLFTVALFIIHALGVAQVFHGPRYPALVTPMWTACLVGAAAWGVQRKKRSSLIALLLVIPWLLCSFLGQAFTHWDEPRHGLGFWRRHAARFFPPPGAPLYVIPPELIPYYRENLSYYNVRSIEALSRAPIEEKDVFILDLNMWRQLWTLRDTYFLHLMKNGKLSDVVDKKDEPKVMEDFRNYLLKGFKHEEARDLFSDGIRPRPREIPPVAVARALPEEQFFNKGWSVIEIGDQNKTFLWAAGGKTIIQFKGDVPPGDYALHIVGYRSEHPEETVKMNLRFLHEGKSHVLNQGQGSFHIKISVTFLLAQKNPSLKVEHPVWRPCDYYENTKDGRTLTFLFQKAWLEPENIR